MTSLSSKLFNSKLSSMNIKFLSNKKIGEKAAKLLKDIGITQSPIDVYRVAKYLGIEVKPDNLGDEISGVLIKQGNKIICGVNEAHSENRQRFTIAHEIGHFVLNHERNGLFVDEHKVHFAQHYRDARSAEGTNWQERQANHFAASLLMPKTFLQNEIAQMSEKGIGFDLSGDMDEAVSSLADKFQVSPISMTYRIGKLGLLDSNKGD